MRAAGPPEARPRANTPSGWIARSSMIQQMKFSGYFLIVWDFIRFAKSQRHPGRPGPRLGRRQPGQLRAWASPTSTRSQYGLLFERFLNPERVSMPDIDIDFCMNRRGEVIQYVTEKYGREQVAQIITFGTLGAPRRRSRTSAACWTCPSPRSTASPSWSRNVLNITLEEALEAGAAASRGRRQSDPRVERSARRRAAARRPGAPRLACTPPASSSRPQPLNELVPLYKTNKRRNRHPVRHERPREARPAQDGLPRA